MSNNIITYNAKLNISKQETLLWKEYLVQAQLAYNDCAEYIITNSVPLNIKDVHNQVYEWMRIKYNSLPSQAIIRVYKEVLAAVRSVKANKHKNAQTPKRTHLSMRIDKRLYSNLSKQGISLTGLIKNKRTFVPFHEYDKLTELFSLYTTTDPLLFIKNNELYLSISFNTHDKPTKNNTAVGVDLGMKRLFVTSEGNAFTDKTYLKKRRGLRFLKRVLQSKGTASAKNHLKKVSRKERNLSKNMCHKACNALLNSTNSSILVLEDLTKIKQNTSTTKNGFKRKHHNNALSQVPFYLFKTILTYKATLVGKQVVSVSPAYTSQTDSSSHKRDGIRKGCRYYCSNGVVFDSDCNAAVNIALRSKHPISSIPPVDGGLMFLNGRACQQPIHNFNC